MKSEKNNTDGPVISDRGNNRHDRDWTKGSTIRNLLALSWPIIVSDSLNLIGPTIDMIWVGRLGAASIAGVGVAGMVLMVSRLGIMGINTGNRAMVARFMGANDNAGAIHTARQAFIVSVAYATIIASIGIIYAESILSLFGVGADVVSEGATYIRVAFISAIAMALHVVPEGIMQASGDTVTPMKISITMRIIHVILGPFLIFGIWIFPRMGVTGAAMASLISLTIGMLISLWVVFTGRSRLRLTLKNFSIDFNIIWRIIKIGLPASVMMAQQRFGRILLLAFVAPFGTSAVAGYVLLERIEVFVRTPAMGFGRGAGVLVGQNLGAREPDRAEKSAWHATGFSESIVIVIAIILFLWPGHVIHIFSPDPQLIKTVGIFLRIMAIGYLTLGFDAVLVQSLSGAGDTMPAMIMNVMRMWVITLPFAYILPKITG
ncbi:MATE family efflux transporter, partial [Thermodesulfobacteriota bacterium]